MTMKTGARYERELINIFDDSGYAALRVPASGSATTRELPDLHVGNGEQTLAIEAKYSSSNLVYLKPEKINGLCWFADRYNSTPLVAGRWSRDTTWYFERPSELYQTDSGKYRIKRADQQSKAIPISDVLDGSVRFDEPSGIVADGGRLAEPNLCPECGKNEAREVVALPGTQGVVLVCPWCARKLETSHE